MKKFLKMVCKEENNEIMVLFIINRVLIKIFIWICCGFCRILIKKIKDKKI